MKTALLLEVDRFAVVSWTASLLDVGSAFDFFCLKICVYKKVVVPLQPLKKNTAG